MISIVDASWLILGVATWIAFPNSSRGFRGKRSRLSFRSCSSHFLKPRGKKQIPLAKRCLTRSPQLRRSCDAASTRLGRALAAWRGLFAASSPGYCAKQQDPVNPRKIDHFIMGKCQFLAGLLFGLLLVQKGERGFLF